ncbi:hypothetical protein [Methylorubrum extorquens]|uniref:hypothetical protein n=1 Tax=Methylorubrum extorquens TaxID=408 RepID=UPI0022377215|nr:hypothetical protein [Methylorubrum extorquens]UYW33634.1 hypothetical protein OKB92_06010 [Methylorubrum extorquens]
MDQNSLVEFGHAVIRSMRDDGISPRAAMWINNTDTQTWKLWIVPPKSLSDKREFYRKMSQIVSAYGDRYPGFDIADIEMIPETHPALKGMSTMFRIPAEVAFSLSGNTFNGFYIPDGILLIMDM